MIFPAVYLKKYVSNPRQPRSSVSCNRFLRFIIHGFFRLAYLLHGDDNAPGV
jgi:hypothetical protein